MGFFVVVKKAAKELAFSGHHAGVGCFVGVVSREGFRGRAVEVVKEDVEGLVFKEFAGNQVVKGGGAQGLVKEAPGREFVEKVKASGLVKKVVAGKAVSKRFVKEVIAGQVSAKSPSSLR